MRVFSMSNAFSFPPGSVDEGVSEGLPSMQGTSNTGGHTEDDERYHDLLQLACCSVIHRKKRKETKCMLTSALSPGVNVLDDMFKCQI